MSEYNNRNLSLLTDLYQLTMMNSFYKQNKHNETAVFDMFFRQTREQLKYSVFAGLEQLVFYIKNLKFTGEDIDYLKSLNLFEEGFLKELLNFKFSGTIYSVKEGTVVFPNEPLIRVTAPLLQAQLIETALLNIVNFQTLIATKASYINIAAGDRNNIVEFGLRRAQGADAGILGSRACYIAGCSGTSNCMAGKYFDIPVRGTLSHSFIMSFEDELSAFRAYAADFPDSCLLLVDTFNTLKSGMKNALTVFKELRDKGYEPVGIRIDSGDLAYLSKECRKLLDESGFEDCKIFASGDLDEYIISDLIIQGARIDFYGVGSKLITGGQPPYIGGVYKLSAMLKDGEYIPKMKVSDNIEKTTNPGIKKVLRLYDNKTSRALADLIMLDDEVIDCSKPLTLYHPVEVWKQMVVEDYYCKELMIKVVENGELVYDLPDISEIRSFCEESLGSFWDEYKRLRFPQKYKVDLSDKLYDLKKSYLNDLAGK